MGTRRLYGQYCGLASALDVLGERWTLLVIRELLIGPARYGDLLANLPAMGTNLLADRLRLLTERGVVEQGHVLGDNRARLYRLTPRGEELRDPVLGLARWGLPLLAVDEGEPRVSSAAWGFLAMQAMMAGRRVPDVDESYEFRVDDEVFRVDIAAGSASARRGPVDDPAIVVTTDATTFVRIGAGTLQPHDALVDQLLAIEGDVAAAARCAALLGVGDPFGVEPSSSRASPERPPDEPAAVAPSTARTATTQDAVGASGANSRSTTAKPLSSS